MIPNKRHLIQLIEEGFFNDWRSISQILDKVDSMGFTIKGKQIGRLAQLLTQLCREGLLERKRILEVERKNIVGKFLYRKRGISNEGTNN
jgi:hypothetical protein